MIERFNFRMTVKNGFCKCLLFVLLPEDDEKSKHGLLVFASSFPGLFSQSRALGTRLFVFPPKKTLIWKGIVRLANCVTVWRQSEVSIDCYKVHTSSHAHLYPFAKPMKALFPFVCCFGFLCAIPFQGHTKSALMSLFPTLLFFSLVFLSSSFRCISKATITRGTGRIFDWLKIRAFINRCSVHTEPPYRDGSRGRVPGVLTPPPEMNCSFLIQLVFCKIWPQICMICILSSSHYVIA